MGLPLSIVTTNWFMCLFVNTLPVDTLLRVWDMLIVHGPMTLIRVGTAILKIHERELLATTDFIKLSVQPQLQPAPPTPARTPNPARTSNPRP